MDGYWLTVVVKCRPRHCQFAQEQSAHTDSHNAIPVRTPFAQGWCALNFFRRLQIMREWISHSSVCFATARRWVVVLGLAVAGAMPSSAQTQPVVRGA